MVAGMNPPTDKALPSPAAPTVAGLADKSLAPAQDKALHAEQDKAAAAAPEPADDDGISVVLIHHWQDHGPGDTVTLPPEMANKLITGSFARLP